MKGDPPNSFNFDDQMTIVFGAVVAINKLENE